MFDFSEKSIFASVLSCSHSLCGARSKSLHFESTGELCSVPCAQSLAHQVVLCLCQSACVDPLEFWLGDSFFPVRCLHLTSISGAVEQALDFHAGISLRRQVYIGP
jgi:hypothetical protein